MTMDEIREQLFKILKDATNEGKKSITIISKHLFDIMENKPIKNHRYPMCCKAMMEIYNEETDEILYQTPSLQSSTLKIKYSLPRM